MKNLRKERSKRTLLDMEEKAVNSMMYALGMIISIGACIAVMGFLGGTEIDLVVLHITVVFWIFRILEKKVAWFEPHAKYAYMTISFWIVCLLCITNDGRYAAATQVLFLMQMVSVAYHDVKIVLWCAAVTIISTIGGLCFFTEAILKLDKPGVWGYIFYMYIMAVILSVIIAKRMSDLLEKTREVKAYEDELVYLEQLEKKEEQQREFIHNINHYFVAIGELARIDKSEQIVNLVEELNGKLRKNERIIYSRPRVLNAILTEKISRAREQGIKFEVNVEPILKLGHIADGDLVSMLGNLLDNALEAAMQCEDEKRKIYLWIYMENGGRVCVVKLVNFFSNPLERSHSGFLTTKKNKQMHGIGIKSVESTAKKYMGYLECLIEGEKFTSILVLPGNETAKIAP